MFGINRDEFFRKNSGAHPFGTQKEIRNFGKVEIRTGGRETKKIKIKLATTCNKNEQQQDAKNNAELQTKWTKKTLKIFEGTRGRGRNRSMKA